MKAPSPYLTGEPEAPSRLSATLVKNDIEAEVRQAAYPDDCPAFAEVLSERAVAEFEFAAPLPIDGEASHADRRLLSDLDANDRRAKDCEAKLDAAVKLRDERTQAVLALPEPKSRAYWFFTWVYMLTFAGIVSFCGAFILAPTIEPALHRMLSQRLDNPDGMSLLVAHIVAGGLFLSVCLAQIGIVHGTRGKATAGALALTVLLDVGFAVAWGLQRLDAPWNLAASVTLLEMVAAASFALCLIGYGADLRRDEPKATPYREALAARKEAERLHAQALREHERAEAKRRELLDHVAKREAGVRRAEERRKLLAVSAEAAYATAVSALANKTAENASADAYTNTIERELAAHAANGTSQKEKSPWRA